VVVLIVDLKISQCPSGFNYLQVNIFNDTFVATIYPEIGQSINVFFPPLAGTYIGTVVTHNYCTGDTPESHVGVVAYLSGACGV